MSPFGASVEAAHISRGHETLQDHFRYGPHFKFYKWISDPLSELTKVFDRTAARCKRAEFVGRF